MIRKAITQDLKQIIELEKEYYTGHSISEEILVKWIKNGNFFVLEENSAIVGSIYFEFLDEIKDLPWYHEPIKSLGKYAYISEIAVDSDDKVPALFDEVLKVARKNDCEGIIWLTGEKGNHDKIEQGFIKTNSFKVFKKVENWECAPGYFVNDHSLWLKKL
jgi:hypothetical protein